MVRRLLLGGVSALAVAAGAASVALAAGYTYTDSPQDVLIGANLVQSMTYDGQPIIGTGVTFGVIDTGAAAAWIGFSGRVAPVPTSTCLITPSCTPSLATADDNGHGTFVTSEIIGSVPSAGYEGVAPGGNAIAVKVLNAQGSGSYGDVANGIIYAANEGAKVLNLSLGPFVQNSALVNAINYAAAKGAVIVFAGGNSSAAFNNGATITGLTDQAIQSLIFMGSTNASQKLSSFSNTPGSGGFVSTTGVFYAYDTRWLMADGENIWGASTYHSSRYGYSYITQMSGTSMAAPQAAGAAGLLLQRWPQLTNTEVATLLLTNGVNLGAAGVDTTYGEGFLNVYNAFVDPVGTLSVSVNGKLVPVGTGSSIVSSSAFGGLTRVASALQHVVAVDSFNRDFPFSLAGSVTSKAAYAPSAASALVLAQSGAGSRNFTDLGGGGWIVTSFAGTSSVPVWAGLERQSSIALIQDPSQPQQTDWSVGLAEHGGFMGVGQGANAALTFNDARWGGKTAFFDSNASVAGALLGLPTGSSFAAAGLDLDHGERFSFAVLTANDDTLARLTGTGASAHGFALGYTVTPTAGLKVSVTGSYLGENNMLLGSPSGGYLALGSAAQTFSLGVGFNLDLGAGYQLGFDSALASTDPSQNANSLIAGTSRLTSAAFGVAMRKDAVVTAGDTLGIGVRMPMRVYAGNAALSLPVAVDGAGNPVMQQMHASLVPTGTETDLELNYDRPLGEVMMGGVSLTYRRDADNVAGAVDSAALVHVKFSF